MFFSRTLCWVLTSHLQGSTYFHHVRLLHYSHSEVVGLHQFLQESAVTFIFTSWTQKQRRSSPHSLLSQHSWVNHQLSFN